jgi:hypothetical protein
MKTAVEWFAKELYEKFEMKGDGKVFDDLLNQSNKLFENQIKDANEEGFHSGQSMAHDGKSKFESAKDYYNKTFKQQEQ